MERRIEKILNRAILSVKFRAQRRNFREKRSDIADGMLVLAGIRSVFVPFFCSFYEQSVWKWRKVQNEKAEKMKTKENWGGNMGSCSNVRRGRESIVVLAWRQRWPAPQTFLHHEYPSLPCAPTYLPGLARSPTIFRCYSSTAINFFFHPFSTFPRRICYSTSKYRSVDRVLYVNGAPPLPAAPIPTVFEQRTRCIQGGWVEIGVKEEINQAISSAEWAKNDDKHIS